MEVSVAPNEDVYNLTVEGEHDFFANGILTHNCDAARYGLVHLDRAFHAPEVFDNVQIEWDGGIDEDDATEYADVQSYRNRWR